MPFKKKNILTLHVMKLVDKIWIKNGIMIFLFLFCKCGELSMENVIVILFLV